MLEPLRNPVNWDNFRKVAVLVLILWATASVLFGIIYFFILGGRSPAPANIFRALILHVPFIAQADSPDWLKFKNPNAPSVKREAEEELSCCVWINLRRPWVSRAGS
jgi:hypothetical protein